MKRAFGIICIIILLLPYFYIPSLNVSGKTLGDLRKELESTIQDLQNNNNEKNLTQ